MKKFPYLSFFILLLLMTASFLAPFITVYGPEEQNIERALLPPSFQHPLGTDELGRDMLSRVLYGGRITFSIAIFSSVIAVFLGTCAGIASGTGGPFVDTIIMRTVDFFYSVPDLLLIVLITVIAGRTPEAIIFSLAITSWASVSRMVRNEVLSIKNSDYIWACRAMGCGVMRTIMSHLVPNILGAILVVLSLRIPVVIIAESSLSFLGLGLNPPQSSWGVLAQAGYRALGFYPHLIFPPAILIFITVYSFNRLADYITFARSGF